MLSVTSGFKTAIKQLDVMSDGKVDITDSSGTVTYTSNDLSKIEINGSAYQGESVLGSIAQHSLTLELLGDQTSNISLTKLKTIKPYIGVYVSGVVEYVPYQDFIAYEVKYNDTTNITKVLAYDKLALLNKEYVDDNTYPMTLKAYLEDVLAFCGLSLENTSFTNSTFSVTSAPFSQYTNCREIVTRIAEMAMSFVVINKTTNKLEFKSAFESPLTPDESITKDYYWKLGLSENNYKTNGLNTLVLRISQVEGENNTKENATNVAIDGAVECQIVDNPFINTEAKRLSVIDGMFTIMDAYKMNPYVVEYRGFPYLEIGDLVQITKMDDTTFVSPIHEVTIRYDGGLYGNIKGKTNSISQTNYKNFNNNLQRIRNAEIKVDKAAADITLKVSSDDIISSINLSPEVITIDTARLNITGLVTISNLTDGTTTISGSNIKTGTIDASVVTVKNLDASKITTGSLSASTITVGGWSVNATSIYKGNTKLDAANDRIYLNTNAYMYGYASGTIGVSGDMQFVNDNKITLASSGGSLELKDGAITSLNASSGLKTLNLNGSKIMTAAHFSLAGTTLTITV